MLARNFSGKYKHIFTGLAYDLSQLNLEETLSLLPAECQTVFSLHDK